FLSGSLIWRENFRQGSSQPGGAEPAPLALASPVLPCVFWARDTPVVGREPPCCGAGSFSSTALLSSSKSFFVSPASFRILSRSAGLFLSSSSLSLVSFH